MDVLNSFLDTVQNDFNIETLIKYIYQNMQHKSYHNRLHYKKYDNSLIQLFSESSQEYTKWDIYNACRSIIFSQETGKIVSYSHSNIEYISYDVFQKRDIQDSIKNVNFKETHEGTLISVFFHNHKWYYATRREIDMYKTHRYVYGEKSILSHGEMFEECLTKIGLTKDHFEQKLDPSYQYYFELVHYDNKINISYDIRFGEKYAKLFLLFVRDSTNNMIDKELFTAVSTLLNISTIPSITYDELISILDSDATEIEGYIYVRTDMNGNSHLCKVLHDHYHSKMIFNSGYKTIQEQYIHLYQNNLLDEVLTKMNTKVYNNQVSEEYGSVDTIGLVNAVFTYIGQRMLDIYYTFNTNTMNHKNEDIFKRIFMDTKEYAIIFYTLGKMKGIHKNKQLTINEIKKFLKYNMSANDVWKLGNVIRDFEKKETLLREYPTKIVHLFWE
jgi:hypothetical protein